MAENTNLMQTNEHYQSMERKIRQKTTKMKQQMEENGYDDSTFLEDSEEGKSDESESDYSSSEDEMLPPGFFARIKYRCAKFIGYLRDSSMSDLKDDFMDWYEDQLFLFRHSS